MTAMRDGRAMRGGARSPLLLLAPLLILVAIVGYAVGQGGSSTPSRTTRREASNGLVTVDYPPSSGWESAGSAPSIPDLPIAHPLVLAPGGDGTPAGLVVGETSGGPRPLPERLLARLSQAPSARVVTLTNVQAYRYSRLAIPGLGTATFYVIPDGPSNSVTAACYARGRQASTLATCEAIAATLALGSSTSAAEVRGYLTPSVSYGRELSSVVTRLDSLREGLRPGIQPGADSATVLRLSRGLANGITPLAQSLSYLQPPTPAAWAQAELLEALVGLRSAYADLADAVAGKSVAAYTGARTKVDEAEAAVDAALQSFAQLGYG
jgi:hypothetical protein